jgi:hypothetical protein
MKVLLNIMIYASYLLQTFWIWICLKSHAWDTKELILLVGFHSLHILPEKRKNIESQKSCVNVTLLHNSATKIAAALLCECYNNHAFFLSQQKKYKIRQQDQF